MTTVVESECRFDGADGGEYLWRCVDMFTVDDGRISRHVKYCRLPDPDRHRPADRRGAMVAW